MPLHKSEFARSASSRHNPSGLCPGSQIDGRVLPPLISLHPVLYNPTRPDPEPSQTRCGSEAERSGWF